MKIISINGDKFNLHVNAVEKILDKIPFSTSVKIVAVTGPFRSGKSFLVNYLMGNINSQRIHGGESGEPIHWASGKDRQTTGIYLCYDEDTQILYLDTQGLFDMNTDTKTTVGLFGLANLLCSHMIFNIPNRIQEDNLQYLCFFAEYCRMVFDKKIPLLTFLVRDCSFSTSEDPQKYINGILTNQENSEIIKTRTTLQKCYNHIDCFLMEHPGKMATTDAFKGEFEQMEKGFVKDLEELKKYIHRNTTYKKLDNQIMDVSKFITILQVYIDTFNSSSGKMPPIDTMLEANMTCFKISTIREYVQEFDRRSLDLCKQISNTKLLLDGFELIKKELLQRYSCKFTPMDELLPSLEEELNEKCKNIFMIKKSPRNIGINNYINSALVMMASSAISNISKQCIDYEYLNGTCSVVNNASNCVFYSTSLLILGIIWKKLT
uniref:Guanylate-binding protein n=1 Tax=Megaviridae environmental sample TaxID=1737588 RepID=A0A5J6VIQ5_9VIRU|nr:MAG: guanylate-binding protein [Megaviridae environmental sample]